MPRAYLRLDPHVYDRKVLGIDRHGAPIEGFRPYPTDALVAFFGVLALADGQSPRGHFRSERILRELLRGGDGRGARYARQVPLLIERGDLVIELGGRLYVDGWTEWQEGDIPPPARMAALARRRGEEADVSPGALRQRRYRERHMEPTSDASPAANHVTRHPVEAEAYSVSNSGGGVTEAEAHAINGAPREMSTDERRETLQTSIATAQAILDDPKASPAAKKAAQHGLETGSARLTALEPAAAVEEPTEEEPAPPEVSFDAPAASEEAPGA
jgi:hypothetical protein